jgi:hypothetical protein
LIANIAGGVPLQKLKLWRAAVLTSILFASVVRADVLPVSTITGTGPGVSGPAWDGSTSISVWGGPFTPTYGQTFLDPSGYPLLTGITFEINNVSAQAFLYQAYVYAWNGSEITGPALFTSAVETSSTVHGFEAVTVATPGTLLTPGNEYIAFFSTIGEGGPVGVSIWGAMQDSPSHAGGASYADGGFFFNNSASFSALATTAWDSRGDLAFTLDFATQDAAPVPEPSTGCLLITFIVLAAVLARRALPSA